MNREELAELHLRADGVMSAAQAFAAYHAEHASCRSSSREFHERAETHIGYAAPGLICDLLAEVDRLRAELAAVRAAAVEACDLADLISDGVNVSTFDDRIAEIRARIGGGP